MVLLVTSIRRRSNRMLLIGSNNIRTESIVKITGKINLDNLNCHLYSLDLHVHVLTYLCP